MNRKTSNTASASPRGMSSRGAATLLLLAVLPPVGVAVLWARRVFRPRGRAVLTALSVLTGMFPSAMVDLFTAVSSALM